MSAELFDKHDTAQHMADLGAKRAAARGSDPATSCAAAEQIEASGKAGRQRGICLLWVQERPGSTAAEIAELAGLDRHAASRRLPELRPSHVRNGPARVCAITGNKSLTWFPARGD